MVSESTRTEIDAWPFCAKCAESILEHDVEHCPRCGGGVMPASVRQHASGTAAAAPTILCNRYKLGAPLARGATGDLYLAIDTAMNKMVVLKYLARPLAADRGACERFLAGAEALAHIAHPHLITVSAAGVDRGVPFLVMPLLKGRMLSVVVHEDGRLPLAKAIDLTRQLCGALGALHEAGVVHGGIAPHNVIVDETGESPKTTLFDLGLSRGGPQLMNDLHHAHAEYLAPEAATSPWQPDARSDLYALGVLFYKLVTGRIPFAGETVLDVVLRHQSDPPPPPNGFAPELPPDVEPVLLRALAKDPAKRFQTAAELDAALAELAEKGGAFIADREATKAHVERARARSKRRLRACSFAGVALAFAASILLSAKDEVPRAQPQKAVSMRQSVRAALEAVFPPHDEPSEAAVATRRDEMPATATVKRTASAEIEAEADDEDDHVAPAPKVQGRVKAKKRARVAKEKVEEHTATDEASIVTEAAAKPLEQETWEPPSLLGAAPPQPAFPLTARARLVAVPAPTPTSTIASIDVLPPERLLPDVAAETGRLRVVTLFEERGTWATITIDGDVAGNSHVVDKELAPGTHEIVVRRAGYREQRTRIEVRPGETARLRIVMERE